MELEPLVSMAGVAEAGRNESCHPNVVLNRGQKVCRRSDNMHLRDEAMFDATNVSAEVLRMGERHVPSGWQRSDLHRGQPYDYASSLDFVASVLFMDITIVS